MKAGGEMQIQYVSKQMSGCSTWKADRLHADTQLGSPDLEASGMG